MSLIPDIFSDEVKRLLKNGEWKYYSSTPPIVILTEDNDYYDPEQVILLIEQDGDISQTFDSVIIEHDQRLLIEGREQNRDKLNRMASDVLNILTESDLSFSITRFSRNFSTNDYRFILLIERIT